MAIRTKTIEYAFGNLTGSARAAGARYSFPTGTIYIPETGSRVFRSVLMEAHFSDTLTATFGTNLTAVNMGIQLNTSSFSQVTNTTTETTTGENMSFMWLSDATTYFKQNFPATALSASCVVNITATTLPVNLQNIKLIITYDFDDSNQSTRIKTVRIPLQSSTTTLTNTLANLGTNQIPALDTFLPEANKVYRQIFLEVIANSATAAASTFALGYRLDADPELFTDPVINSSNSATWHRFLLNTGSFNTATTHNLQLRSNPITTRFTNPGAILTVTYEYDHSATTRVMNSLLFPLGVEAGGMGTATNYSSRHIQELYINEPGTIVLSQSGVALFYMCTGANVSTIRVRCNNQLFSSYIRTHGTISSGQYSLVHRIDSGSVSGSALTLGQGKNVVLVEYDQTANTTHTATAATGLVYLNYTSDLHPSGADSHASTRIFGVNTASQVLVSAQRWDAIFSASAPVEPWRTVGVGFRTMLSVGGTDTGFSLKVRPTGSIETSSIAEGFVPLYSSLVDTNGERAIVTSYMNSYNVFRQYSNDPIPSRIDLTSPRLYRLEIAGPTSTGNAATSDGSVTCYWTYHQITSPVTRSIVNYSGDGSGLAVRIFDANTQELLYATQSLSGGTYQFLCHDRNRQMFAKVYDASTNRGGISRPFTPFPS